jgi:hypothetical protein
MGSYCCLYVCLYMFPPFRCYSTAHKLVPSATNTQDTIEELLDPSFSIRLMSYQREVDDELLPKLLVMYPFWGRGQCFWLFTLTHGQPTEIIKNWFKENSVEDVGWVYLAQDRDKWRTLVNRVMKCWVLHKNSGALVCQRTVPTKRPPLVGEDSANFSG